ncbi:MAG: hypothetical protein M5U34_08380 [Chloroflexi bacterium]|nr:hypothetical protein [Chloroflexota bacterium]
MAGCRGAAHGELVAVVAQRLCPQRQSLLGRAGRPPAFFACPSCGAQQLEEDNGRLPCPHPPCQKVWSVQDGLYDFKEPVS